MQFTQLGGDSIAVIWTMVERHDPDSHWAAFWQSLPETLHSGLTMSDTLLQALQGTSAHTECHSARQVREHHHSQRHRWLPYLFQVKVDTIAVSCLTPMTID